MVLKVKTCVNGVSTVFQQCERKLFRGDKGGFKSFLKFRNKGGSKVFKFFKKNSFEREK